MTSSSTHHGGDPVERLRAALEAADCAPKGHGKGRARCPAHEDRSPSLTWGTGDDGQALVHCFAGCEPSEVVAALGLEMSDLFPPNVERGGRGRWLSRKIAATRSRTVESADCPPSRELLHLWNSCLPIHMDAEVGAWLASHNIDADAVEAEAELRALPRGSSVPRWARYRGRSWAASGHRAILALRGPSGDLISLLVCAVEPVDAGAPTTLSPAGFRRAGGVMADDLARELLAGRRHPYWNGVLVVVEDEIEFLAWTLNRSDEPKATFGVIGVPLGAWTAELAARVPDGTTVALRTQPGSGGGRLAADLERTLSPRCLVRVVAGGAR